MLLSRLFVILVIASFPYIASAAISEQTARLVDSIMNGKFINLQTVNCYPRDPFYSNQWQLYQQLKQTATTKELAQLTSSSSPEVRCYAFLALAEQKRPEVFSILLEHLSDTEAVNVELYCGDRYRHTLVGDVFLKILSPTGDVTKEGKKLDALQQQMVDSLLLHKPFIKLYAKDELLGRQKPTPEYYKRVRALAFEEDYPKAVLLLAKYRKTDDSLKIVAMFDNPDFSHWYNAVEAALIYRDSLLQEKTIEIFARERAKRSLDDGSDGWQKFYLIRILVAYSNERAKAVLKETMDNERNYLRTRYFQEIKDALTEFPSAVIESIFPNYKLSSPIQKLVDSMAIHGSVHGSVIGAEGITSEQWLRYKKLEQSATDQELLQLVDHHAPAVRCYSFEALANRKNEAVAVVYLQHLRDPYSVMTLTGCLGDERPVCEMFRSALFDGRDSLGFTLELSDNGKTIRLPAVLRFTGTFHSIEVSTQTTRFSFKQNLNGDFVLEPQRKYSAADMKLAKAISAKLHSIVQ